MGYAQLKGCTRIDALASSSDELPLTAHALDFAAAHRSLDVSSFAARQKRALWGPGFEAE